MATVYDVEDYSNRELAAAVKMLEKDTCCKCAGPCAPGQVFCSLCELGLLSGKLSFVPSV